MRLLLLAAWLVVTASGQVCGRDDIYGTYGFRLSGIAAISADPKPVAAVGRLLFDSDRKINGVSSVNFDGFFLGNPVTGTFEFAEKDCSVTFALQDDSGGWQHFRGQLATGGNQGTYTQIDPGAEVHGVLEKTPETCDNSVFQGKYTVALGAQKTVTMADGAGKLSWNTGDVTNSGTYQVDSGCFVELDFGIHLRGILVNGGKKILAVQTDPGSVGIATFTAQ